MAAHRLHAHVRPFFASDEGTALGVAFYPLEALSDVFDLLQQFAVLAGLLT
jgi:hypothetical protein